MAELRCVIRMVGGLGNQLFQYALGRALEMELAAGVRYDVSQYAMPGERALSILKLRARLAKPSAVDRASMRLSFGRTLRKLRPLLGLVCPSAVWRVYSDPCQGFDPTVRQLRGLWYLLGWWQSPEYFERIRPTLLEEFQPAQELTGQNLDMKRQIEGVNSVCVHVRRGDLVTAPPDSRGISSSANLVQSPGFYHAGMAEICARVNEPHFFVFSDDAEWAKQNIHCDAPVTYVARNGRQQDYLDLHLMSSCRHFITANSTFSWWGAWLSKNADKIVIVPPVWARDGAGPPAGLIPDGWQIGPAIEEGAAAAATIEARV
jgi:hypothetical protein